MTHKSRTETNISPLARIFYRYQRVKAEVERERAEAGRRKEDK